MRKFVDISLGFAFFIISIILCLYTNLILQTNVEADMSKNEFVISVISLLLFGVLYSIYMKRSKRRAIGILLLLSLSSWISDMINAIKNNYSAYTTIVSIIGFVITGYCVLFFIYQLVTDKKSV